MDQRDFYIFDLIILATADIVNILWLFYVPLYFDITLFTFSFLFNFFYSFVLHILISLKIYSTSREFFFLKAFSRICVIGTYKMLKTRSPIIIFSKD